MSDVHRRQKRHRRTPSTETIRLENEGADELVFHAQQLQMQGTCKPRTVGLGKVGRALAPAHLPAPSLFILFCRGARPRPRTRPSSPHTEFVAPHARCHICCVFLDVNPGHRVRALDRSKYTVEGSAYFDQTPIAHSLYLLHIDHDCCPPSDHTTSGLPSRPRAISRCPIQYATPPPFT